DAAPAGAVGAGGPEQRQHEQQRGDGGVTEGGAVSGGTASGGARAGGHGSFSSSAVDRRSRGGAKRCSPLYTLKRPGRRKPTRVWLPSRARPTARLDGADTEHTTGMPARRAFCTISNPARPE